MSTTKGTYNGPYEGVKQQSLRSLKGYFIGSKGSFSPTKGELRSLPPLQHYSLLFYLGNRYSKKLVLTLSAEGKKWSLRIHEGECCGKKWEKMFIYVGGKYGEGIIPHA